MDIGHQLTAEQMDSMHSFLFNIQCAAVRLQSPFLCTFQEKSNKTVLTKNNCLAIFHKQCKQNYFFFKSFLALSSSGHVFYIFSLKLWCYRRSVMKPHHIFYNYSHKGPIFSKLLKCLIIQFNSIFNSSFIDTTRQ